MQGNHERVIWLKPGKCSILSYDVESRPYNEHISVFNEIRKYMVTRVIGNLIILHYTNSLCESTVFSLLPTMWNLESPQCSILYAL